VAAAACALTWLVNSLVPSPFVVFFPSLFLSSWLGDRDAGMPTVALTTAYAPFLLPPDGYQMHVEALPVLFIYAGCGLLIVSLVSRLQETVASRDALMSVLSHDLKSPLGSLRLRVETIQRKVRRGQAVSADDLDTTTSKLIRQIDQLSALVSNLLDLGRLRAGRLTLQRQPVDLGEVTREIVERYEHDLRDAGSAVTLLLGEPRTGHWDPMAVDQIVTNLVSNAVKYGEGQPISLASGGDARHVWLEVEDHGRGMSIQEQRDIFRAFEKAGGGHGHKQSHGLGLWIVRRLVEAHGGRVAVRSSPERGTTFRVELPR
jgi:signal transduction histidine kinase